jgi:hypothetical protein
LEQTDSQVFVDALSELDGHECSLSILFCGCFHQADVVSSALQQPHVFELELDVSGDTSVEDSSDKDPR